MKWLLAAALLTSTAGLLCAQEPAAASGTPSAGMAVVNAFELEIHAPDDIRLLLERHLELPRYRELNDLTDSELARLLTLARQNTRDLLATLGYFSPDIGIEQKTAASGPVTRRVILSVAPGTATLVSEVQVEFGGPVSNDPVARLQRQRIQANWLLRPGMRFTQAGWEAAKQQAMRELTGHRYPAGQIGSSQADIDPAQHSARLSITLDSGPAYRIGALVVSGLQRYDMELVTRLARLAPGSDYEQSELVQAQQRLSDSGFFDSVFVSLDTRSDPGNATVQVQLHESLLQKLVLGIGASTDSGARLSAEHTHHQLPGLGWRAASKLSLDRETRSIGSELTAPPDAANWRWVTSALLQNQHGGSSDISSQRLRAGRSQGGPRIDRNYYLQYDRARSTASDASTPAVSQALSANYAFTLRNFDSLPFPTSGWGLGMEVGGGSTLGRQRDPYGRLLMRWLTYLPLAGRHDTGAPAQSTGQLVFRAETGAVFARSDASLPATQMFLTGGDKSVRGYGYHELGVTRPDGQTSAGRHLGLASLEWQRPITLNGRLTDWESAVFIDAGAVADKVADLRAKVGVGVGARWKSPVGPLQVDLAYGFAVERLRLHLNVGFSF